MSFRPAQNDVLLHAPAEAGWLYFRGPLSIISAERSGDVLPALQAVEEQVAQRGRWAAGFVTYEAAPAMDSACVVRPAPAGLPLVWFGIYAGPERLPEAAIQADWGAARLPEGWQATLSQARYRAAIKDIKKRIAAGDTYQVNYTYRLRAPYDQPAWPLFAALAGAHQAPYAAFLDTGRWALLSLSPELFFSLQGSLLTSRPMKGTAPRGRTLEEDQTLAAGLRASEKERAENIMILDMVRNDLGRLARAGSVRVPELLALEKYPTVWQMTSTAQAESAAPLPELFRALFPAASITGAPKISSMRIIAGLESTPRGVYTGAIGFYGPGRQAQFNVAIRTLLLDQQRRTAEYGVGGGITWDSNAQAEWDETRAKARLLYELPEPFELLETLRWTPAEGWFLLDQHLDRLSRSAEYFSYPLDWGRLLAQLAEVEKNAQGAAQRVRLRLARSGKIWIDAVRMPPGPNPSNVALARTPVDSRDPFLYHKTTRRARYGQALSEQPEYPDVLLWNERGELTESTIANLFVELDGRLVTPPLSCGLLPGTYRAWLLERGEAVEGILRPPDLRRGAVYLANSVRGLWPVRVEGLT